MLQGDVGELFLWISVACQWFMITISGYIDNPDSSVILLQKSQPM